jgi:hypothetical protein
MKSIAQASAWVRFIIGDRPEGAAEDLRYATPQNSSAPSGQDVIKKGLQGKPWAMLSRPFRPQILHQTVCALRSPPRAHCAAAGYAGEGTVRQQEYISS